MHDERARKQLESRFGPLPSAAGAELEAMTGERLTELGCDLLNASSLAESGLGDPQNGD